MKKNTTKPFSANKKAYHNYTILDTIEAGMVLHGCEVKSIRASQISLASSYAKIINNEVWLLNCHISPYPQSHHFIPDPLRERKLLLHRSEIKKLIGKTEIKKQVLIPLKVYLKNNTIKVLLGLGQAKTKYDKRQVLKERHIDKEITQTFKANQRVN